MVYNSIEILAYNERTDYYDIFDYDKGEPYRISRQRLEKILSIDLEPESNLNKPNVPTCVNYNMSKPEKVVFLLLLINGESFEFQRKLDNSRRRFDFFVLRKTSFVIEVNGEQHYSKGNTKYSKNSYYQSIKSDNYKVNHCRDRHIPIYFIDARKSSISYILDSFTIYEDLNYLVSGVTKKEFRELYKNFYE